MRSFILGISAGLLCCHAAMAVDASTSTNAPYAGVSMETGASIAMQMNQCIAKKLDAEKMKSFQAWADGESVKIKKLCDEGKRDEAMQAQEKMAKALQEKDELKIIKACSEAAQATLSPAQKKNFNAQSNALLLKAEERKHHPCDPVPTS